MAGIHALTSIAPAIVLLSNLSFAVQPDRASPPIGALRGAASEVRDPLAERAPPSARRACPSTPAPRTVQFRRIEEPVGSQAHHERLSAFARDVWQPNTTVLLAPDVVLDFSRAADLVPISFGRCVTLRSVDSFRSRPVLEGAAAAASPAAATAGRSATAARAGQRVTDAGILSRAGPGRTPQSLGPLLRFGSQAADERAFLMIGCPDAEPGRERELTNDHVTISGIRIEGPSLGQQEVDRFGIYITRCLDIEISNNEIYGWGGAGVRVLDDQDGQEGPGQSPGTNFPGDRIGSPGQIRITGNYFHHNQHASEDESVDCDFTWDWVGLKWVGCELFRGHAAGYGVNVHHGAWALIDSNLFDMNRHAIAASGKMGGYDARRNLVLKGGGYHGRTFHTYTHQFDIHGAGENGMGGKAGVQSWYYENSFQFRNAPAIKIRGRPALRVYIGNNIFPHEGLEDDWGDDAIHLRDRDDLDVIELLSGNTINYDSYGRYGVCDFDGDGIDDLFLPTGRTWWFSSFGEFPWSFLAARTQRLDQVRLGYFDDDRKCDVLSQSGGSWVLSSGGTGQWRSIGSFNPTLDNIAFGRFNPAERDHRAGVTRRTTHAFRRLASGQWQVTSLGAPDWQDVQSSSFPMNKLRFGDFTGDGMTDVLAVSGGRWAISDGARGGWTPLNDYLGDDVSSLLIADLNNNNKDDLLKLAVSAQPLGTSGRVRLSYKWYVSDDGRSRWKELKSYDWIGPALNANLAGRAFAGRFGQAPGGGVLLTDMDRVGHFYAPGETVQGRSADWRSLFGY